AIRPLKRIPRLRKLSFPVIADGKSSRNRDEGKPFAVGVEHWMYAVETPIRVSGTVTVKTNGRSAGRSAGRVGYGGQPGRSRGAGVLHQFGVRRMLKCLLALAIVIEAELVHRVVADRPGVSNVPLLEALRHNVSEAGEIGACQFEAGKGVERAIVVEIVIEAQVLLFIQPVVDFNRDLIAAHRLGGDSADKRTAVRRGGNQLQQVNGSRIH